MLAPHHPCQVYQNMDYTLHLPQKDYGETFYTSEKNWGHLKLILKCKDKTLFKTTVSGKPLAQVGSMLRENPGKHLYLLVYTSVSFISGVSAFDTLGLAQCRDFLLFNTLSRLK